MRADADASEPADDREPAGTVFAVAGAKGGVGKTTTTINLGAAIAARGYAVVAVELDLAMANMVDFLSFEGDPDPTVHDVLAGTTDPLAAVYERRAGDLAVAPSGTELTGFADTDLNHLAETVETYRRHFDVVLLDTGAGISQETIEPLKLADETVLVSTPRVAAIRDADKTKQLVERVGGRLVGLVLTKSGTGASPGADRISAFLETDLLGHVPEDDAVPDSQDHGEPVVIQYPNSGAAHAYRLIAKNLLDGEKWAKVNSTTDGGVTSTDLKPASTVSDGGQKWWSDTVEPGTVADDDAEDDDADGTESRERADSSDGGGETGERSESARTEPEATGPDRSDDASGGTDPGTGDGSTNGDAADDDRSLVDRFRSMFGG